MVHKGEVGHEEGVIKALLHLERVGCPVGARGLKAGIDRHKNWGLGKRQGAKGPRAGAEAREDVGGDLAKARGAVQQWLHTDNRHQHWQRIKPRRKRSDQAQTWGFLSMTQTSETPQNPNQ